MTRTLCPTRLLLPGGFVHGHCVLVEAGRIAGIVPAGDLPAGAERELLDGDLVPGFIDLQVNGGGGVLFNDDPTVAGIAAIAAAHRRFGTTGMLPTLITDAPDVIDRAMRAVEAAIEAGVPGVLGIHIEGPFINVHKRGIHDAAKIRAIDEEAVKLLTSLRVGKTLVTLAPELAPAGAIEQLVAGGVVVAAGHSAATYEQTRAGIAAGVTGFTHLYNAMTPLGSREPGMVGAALDSGGTWCGIIADGHHVHPAALRVALAAKGEAGIVLVTDAMPPVATDDASFELNGRHIRVETGKLSAEDGTLAGSALDMAGAVRNAADMLQVDFAAALRMASLSPACAMGLEKLTGSIGEGLRADLVLLQDGEVSRTWVGGRS